MGMYLRITKTISYFNRTLGITLFVIGLAIIGVGTIVGLILAYRSNLDNLLPIVDRSSSADVAVNTNITNEYQTHHQIVPYSICGGDDDCSKHHDARCDHR